MIKFHFKKIFTLIFILASNNIYSQSLYNKIDYEKIEDEIINGIELLLVYKYGESNYTKKIISTNRTISESSDNSVTFVNIENLNTVSITKDDEESIVSYSFTYKINDEELSKQNETVRNILSIIMIDKISFDEAKTKLDEGGNIQDSNIGKIFVDSNDDVTLISDDLTLRTKGVTNSGMNTIYEFKFNSMSLNIYLATSSEPTGGEKISVYLTSRIKRNKEILLFEDSQINKIQLKSNLGV